MGSYKGRLDGRNATLQIASSSSEQTLRIVSHDVDRDARKENSVRAPTGDNAHILRGPFGDRDEMLLLHRHDRRFISMRGKWNNVSFGRAFSVAGFDAPSGGNFDKNRWQRLWGDTFEGRDDGRPATLRVQTRDGNNRDMAEFDIELTIDDPNRGQVVYNGMHSRPIGDEPRMHILEDVTLRSEDGKSRRIRELLMHTWGVNYITGIAEMPDRTVVGQLFVRQ